MAIKAFHEVLRRGGAGDDGTWEMFTEQHVKADYLRYMKQAEDEAAKPGRERSLAILNALKNASEEDILVVIVCAYGGVDSMYFAPEVTRAALGLDAHFITWDPKGWWKNVEGLYPDTLQGSAGGNPTSGFFLDYFGLFHELGHCYQCLKNPVWYNEMVAHAKTPEGQPTWCNWLIEQLNISENEHFLTQEVFGRYRTFYTNGNPIKLWFRETGQAIVEALKSKAATSGGAYFSNYQPQDWSGITDATTWWARVKEATPPVEVPLPSLAEKPQTPHKKWPTVQAVKGFRSLG